MTRWIAALSLAALMGAALTAAPAQAAPEKYEIDPEHFSIVFFVSHVGYGNLAGMFLEGEGEFLYDADTQSISDLTVEIEADSVFTNHKRRDRHLRSADFLDAREFPKITFTMTRAEPESDTTGRIYGTLELLGQSREIVLEVTRNKHAKYPFGHKKLTLGISASTSFKRSDFGMMYAVDDGMVGDVVEMCFEFEALKQ